MDDDPACGKGLAENAALPAKLGELTASVADILEAHAMAASAVLESFQRFVELEQELLALIQRRVEQDRQMLVAMGVPG